MESFKSKLQEDLKKSMTIRFLASPTNSGLLLQEKQVN